MLRRLFRQHLSHNNLLQNLQFSKTNQSTSYSILIHHLTLITQTNRRNLYLNRTLKNQPVDDTNDSPQYSSAQMFPPLISATSKPAREYSGDSDNAGVRRLRRRRHSVVYVVDVVAVVLRRRCVCDASVETRGRSVTKRRRVPMSLHVVREALMRAVGRPLLIF